MKTTHLFISVLLLSSCGKKQKPIANSQDYQSYLSFPKSISGNSLQEEVSFWSERYQEDHQDEVALMKLAGLYARQFKSSGQVNDIITSDSLYNSVLKSNPGGSVDIYHCLATNAITQHKFKLAKEYAEKALHLKDKKASTLMILTDVSLELGDYATARRTLMEFRNKNSFAYLIRKAKLKDHEGDLDGAIFEMERAHQRIKGNKELSQWTLSNLADMYGHAGRIEEAYRTYLRALKISPKDDYSLKGIAWIVFSRDHNPAEARKIINILASRKRMPEACLMLAEIASFEGNENEKLHQLKKFRSLVSGPAYKTMYHKYLAIIEAENFHNPDATIDLAKIEIKNRPTPQSYDLLAWGLYHQKNYTQALEVARRNVDGQTFEPDAYYHLGMIYKATGDKIKSEYFLKEALKSEFELGPTITKNIHEALQLL